MSKIIKKQLPIPDDVSINEDAVVNVGSDSELEEEEPKIEPGPTRKAVFLDLKFPIDVKNIIAKNIMIRDAFGYVDTVTYDVTCFSSIKNNIGYHGSVIQKEYPGYQYRFYAYRAIKRCEGTVISKLKLVYNADHKKKFVHINVELLE